jgi:adenosine deaminase
MVIQDFNFIEALKNSDKEKLRLIAKADLHNHAVFSCDREYLSQNNIDIPLDQRVNNISDLINFARKYIKPLQNNKEGLSMLLNGTFEKCLETGVSIVDTNIDYKICIQVFEGNISDFVSFLKSFQYKNLKIHWIIDISRDSYLEEYEETIIELIKTNFFYGIDLTSTENCVPNIKFKNIYALANKNKLITKVHCGEQLGADYIKQCIYDFDPKQIQHGIRIIEDEDVMELAKSKGIIFNVCPTSNLVLNYAKNLNEHPIAYMVKYGLNVTIGTDDILFFESDINDEYLKLYENKVLTAEQLNKIRQFSLNV